MVVVGVPAFGGKLSNCRSNDTRFQCWGPLHACRKMVIPARGGCCEAPSPSGGGRQGSDAFVKLELVINLTQARMGHPGHGVPQKRQEHAWTLETERKGHSSSVPPCGQDAVMAPIICFVQERVSQVFGDLDSSPWGSSLCTVLVP